MTYPQMRIFWRVFKDACDALGLSDEHSKDDYRYRVIKEEADCNHLKEVSCTTGFEKVMARLHSDAGDYAAASAYFIGDEKRMVAMLNDCARQILELTGKNCTSTEYVRGILRNARIASVDRLTDTWWLDYPSKTPYQIFQIIDTHRRRLIKRRNSDTEERLRLTYKFGTVYDKR